MKCVKNKRKGATNPIIMTVNFKNENNSRDFPAGSVTKTPHSQCRGPRFDSWSGNLILHAAAKRSICCNKDGRSPMPQLRPSAAK